MCLISKVTGRNLMSGKEFQHYTYDAVLLNNNNDNNKFVFALVSKLTAQLT